MIWNIVDKRTRPYRWLRVNTIVEATAHDNTVLDSDVAPKTDVGLYDQREGISVSDAVVWANSFAGATTLFLYDEGDGTAAAPLSDEIQN